ncbi:hypothetical protein IFT67_15150 [Sphingomonas sp. CFBP 13728]|uniref:hypothetical protein n=1 Tax=Sphingomonas sp. CFBP 13728 TaxID=2775294 RepID=UPI001786B271|nr:hypothetical protein [Sphingomonas sp. CFBP 13728]MBD8620265.1 hypothetical protein [Sphingomonas sp. CFBP 13728]
MFAIILSALLQVSAHTAAPAAPPLPEHFSILVDPCATQTQDGNEIIVCGKSATTTPRLPMRDDRGPSDHAVAFNPDLSAARALQLEGTPCAASQWGCQVGFGPPIAPIAKAAVGLIKSALAKKPDKRGRVPIDLDGPVGTVN